VAKKVAKWRKVLEKTRAPTLRVFPNLGMRDIFTKEVQLRYEKHEHLKIKQCALFLTCELLISAIGVIVTIRNIFTAL
jgi:hypothetical protein